MRTLAFAWLTAVMSIAARPSDGLAATASHSVSASVDRPECTLDDVIVLTVAIDGKATGEPHLPDLEAFTVTSNGQSSQVQIVNGHMTSSVSHTYTLTPKRTGTFTIAAITAEIGGQQYQSQPLTVRVTTAATATRQQDAPAFITASVSNAQPYAGEQVVYTFRFYRRVPVLGARLDLPDFEKLSPEPLGDKTERTEQYQGQLYSVTEIKKALFAQEAGTYPIAAATLAIDMQAAASPQQKRGDPFDDLDSGFPFAGGLFGRNRVVTRTLRSAPLELGVRPLPSPPSGFSGLVGSCSLQTSLSKRELAVGDSATLEIRVNGRGNVRNMSEPVMPEMPAFKLYDDRPETEMHAEGDIIVGRKVFRKALVPHQPGDFIVPAFSLSCFDTTQGQYALARSAPITVHVVPNASAEVLHAVGAGGDGRAAPTKQTVEIVGDDILPIHPRSPLRTITESQRCTQLAVAGFAFPPLAFLALFLTLRRREHWQRNPSLQRRHTALRRALASLAQARAYARVHDADMARRTLERTLKIFVGDKLNLQGGALTAVDLATRLQEAQVPAALVQRVRDHLEGIEAASYGQKGSGAPAVAAPMNENTTVTTTATAATATTTSARLEAMALLLRDLDRAL